MKETDFQFESSIDQSELLSEPNLDEIYEQYYSIKYGSSEKIKLSKDEVKRAIVVWEQLKEVDPIPLDKHITTFNLDYNPQKELNIMEKVALMASDRVIANLGEEEFLFRGGYNRMSGLRSKVTVSSILLTKEKVMSKRLSGEYIPPYSNRGLFSRDGHMCLYCGETFSPHKLTRDHIIPKSRGGDDSWLNSATSCTTCNHDKSNRTPEEWGHLLLAIPFIPNWSEFLYLKNTQRIIADQQKFLQERFPKGSVLL